jgi:2Fe-2S ferredoxin
MQEAKMKGFAGILAECGGACACGTCHGYVEGIAAASLPAPDANAVAMLAAVPGARPNSRLSCQIKSSSEIDGLVFRIAEQQI